jgi:hypothetical protein
MAYRRRCFYCSEPLSWDSMEIDHVIPERLDANPTDRACVFSDLVLPDDWCLTTDQNLVPACHRCNSKKLASLLPTKQLILLLTKVAEKAPEVALLREQYEQEERVDFTRVKLEIALAMGHLNEADLGKALAKTTTENDRVQVARGRDFLIGLTEDNLRPSKVNELVDLPVRLGADLPDGLPFKSKDEASERLVRTVREYRAAITSGYYAYSTFGMKMEAFFKDANGMLTALEACRPSANSFIRSPRVGLCDIDLLPTSLLLYVGEDAKSIASITTHATIGEAVRARKVSVVQVSSSFLTVEFAGDGTHMREILRADLDGDGYEDLLVSRYQYAVGGSLGLGLEPVALARRSPDEPFTQTKIIPSPALSA